MSDIVSANLNINDKIGLFKAGQKYSNITDENLKPIFKDLDLDNNDELSQNEIDAFSNYLKLKDENYKKHQELDSAKCKASLPWISGGIIGAIGGAIGATGADKIMKSVYDKTNGSNNWFNKTFFKKIVTKHFATGDSKNYNAGDYLYSTTDIVGTSIKNKLVIAGGLLTAGLVGYGVYMLVSKLASVKDAKKNAKKLGDEVKQSDVQIKKLDEQYKHFNVQKETIEKIHEQTSDGFTMDDALKIIFGSNLIFMMMDDERKRREKEDEEKYGEYYRQNIERSKYNSEHNMDTNRSDEIVIDQSMGG